MIMKRPKTIEEWQGMFNDIFSERNAALQLVDIWLHLIEEAGEVAEDLRKEDFNMLNEDLPDIFAWLCASANKFGHDLGDMIWTKFPAVCPYCEREKNCICIAESYPKYDPKRLRDYQLREDNKPSTLDEWQAMFEKIYGNVNKIISRSAIGFHLMEEIGEVARSIRLGDRDSCKEELADVFAWIIAIVMRAREIGSFSDALWNTYPGICKVCEQKKCICKVRPTLTGPKK